MHASICNMENMIIIVCVEIINWASQDIQPAQKCGMRVGSAGRELTAGLKKWGFKTFIQTIPRIQNLHFYTQNVKTADLDIKMRCNI